MTARLAATLIAGMIAAASVARAEPAGGGFTLQVDICAGGVGVSLPSGFAWKPGQCVRHFADKPFPSLAECKRYVERFPATYGPLGLHLRDPFCYAVGDEI